MRWESWSPPPVLVCKGNLCRLLTLIVIQEFLKSLTSDLYWSMESSPQTKMHLTLLDQHSSEMDVQASHHGRWRQNILIRFWRGEVSLYKSTGISERVRETGSVCSPNELFKTRDLELLFFRDLSQIVSRMPQDTPVSFHTRASLRPIREASITW